uniref:Arf-GAP domain-containing protein n=1 Tax=Spongospora subterranea TaxID=70186 RepID=A0A0H5RPI9_9EUKA|eukprot:CRZ10639.1 hypothetical protein [Spongospora subterranea]
MLLAKSGSQTGPHEDPHVQKQVMTLLWRELERPGNQECADCGQRDPEWASINLGILVCTNCVGIHRSLGVSISNVRSITLDRWDNSQLSCLQNVGNSKSNRMYEYMLPVNSKLTPTSSMEARAAFIRQKYVDKAFVDSGVLKRTPRSRDVPEIQHEAAESTMPSQLVDYLVVFGRGTRLRNLTFEPKLLDKIPATDYPDFPLQPEAVGIFAFPEDISLSTIQHPPSRVLFSLTSATGVRQYAVGVLFWELMTPMEIVEFEAHSEKHQECAHQHSRAVSSASSDVSGFPQSLYSPKCIIVLSHWPFFNTFEKWLAMLYRISLSCAPLPLERFIANFIMEVPVPPAGKTAVQFTIADQSLRIVRPPPNSLPLCDCRMATLFQCLDLNNVVALITAMITEQKIVLCSSQRSALLDVCEAASALIFPLTWQGVYMPVLPKRLSEFIHAPVPFIAGISSSYLLPPNPVMVPSEVVFFNLDTNDVLMPAPDTLPPLPDKPLRKLLECLRPLVSGQLFSGRDDVDAMFPYSEHLVPIDKFGEGGLVINELTTPKGTKKLRNRFKRVPPAVRPPSSNTNCSSVDSEAVRDIFLRFMVKLLGRYRQFLIPSENGLTTDEIECLDTKSLFDHAAALRDANESFRPLLAAVTETQMFERFIADRWTPSCQANDRSARPEVRFFDDCVVAKLNRSNFHLHRSTPFLDDTSYAITTTFVVPFPNRVGVTEDFYEYEQFPKLKPELLGPIRPVEPLIKSERRPVVSTLARRVNNELMKGRIVPQFQSWERLRRAAIVIQSRYRACIPRRLFLALKRQSVFVEDRMWYLRHQRASSFLQASLRVYICRVHRTLLVSAAAANMLSSMLRSYLAMQSFNKLRQCTVVLQAGVCAIVCKVRREQIAAAVIKVQSRVRMQIQRRRYLSIVASIVQVQAVFRGHRVRCHQGFVIQEGIASCRTKLAELWNQLHTDIYHRSQFWSVLEDPSYMSWMMHIEEVHRLQAEFKQRTAKADADAKSLLIKQRSDFYHYMKVTAPKADRERSFTEMGLKGGYRKKRLSQTVWSVPGQESISAKILVSVETPASLAQKDAMAEIKNIRIKSNLHKTTMSSLKAVVRLQLRVNVLRAKAQAAASSNARLSIRNQLLLRQANSLVQNAMAKTQIPSTSLRQVYRPQYDDLTATRFSVAR